MTHSKYTTLAAVVLSLGLTACGDETKVSVTDHAGVAIANATVSMDGKQVKSNELGIATISREQADKISTLAITAPGYINQSLEIEAVDPNDEVKRSISATLKAKNPVQTIADISKGGSVSAADGSVFVDFTPGSFVTPDGQPATGAAEVSITPWYPTDANDMAAFLGDGYAQDLQGDMGQLLSYGAMTVQFTQNGQKLQLAQNKKATISMPLSFDTDYNGEDMAVGQTIPMWYFDEGKGFWVEEGAGEVIANADGTMALTADVSHFTTWNWDMMFDNPASVFVQCQLPDNTFVNCTVSATVTYNNGASTKSKQIRLPSTGGDMVNLDPNLDSMTFKATYIDELNNKVVGTFTSKGLPADNKAIIKLDKLLENVKVKCQLADGSAVACGITANLAYSDGTSEVRNSTISQTGGFVTGIHADSLTMANFAGVYYDFDKKMKYSGIVELNNFPTGEVVITLSDEEAIDTTEYLTEFSPDDFINITYVTYRNGDGQPVEITADQYTLAPTDDGLLRLILNDELTSSGDIEETAVYSIFYDVSDMLNEELCDIELPCSMVRTVILSPERKEWDDFIGWDDGPSVP